MYEDEAALTQSYTECIDGRGVGGFGLQSHGDVARAVGPRLDDSVGAFQLREDLDDRRPAAELGGENDLSVDELAAVVDDVVAVFGGLDVQAVAFEEVHVRREEEVVLVAEGSRDVNSPWVVPGHSFHGGVHSLASRGSGWIGCT